MGCSQSRQTTDVLGGKFHVIDGQASTTRSPKILQPASVTDDEPTNSTANNNWKLDQTFDSSFEKSRSSNSADCENGVNNSSPMTENRNNDSTDCNDEFPRLISVFHNQDEQDIPIPTSASSSVVSEIESETEIMHSQSAAGSSPRAAAAGTPNTAISLSVATPKSSATLSSATTITISKEGSVVVSTASSDDNVGNEKYEQPYDEKQQFLTIEQYRQAFVALSLELKESKDREYEKLNHIDSLNHQLYIQQQQNQDLQFLLDSIAATGMAEEEEGEATVETSIDRSNESQDDNDNSDTNKKNLVISKLKLDLRKHEAKYEILKKELEESKKLELEVYRLNIELQNKENSYQAIKRDLEEQKKSKMLNDLDQMK